MAGNQPNTLLDKILYNPSLIICIIFYLLILYAQLNDVIEDKIIGVFNHNEVSALKFAEVVEKICEIPKDKNYPLLTKTFAMTNKGILYKILSDPQQADQLYLHAYNVLDNCNPVNIALPLNSDLILTKELTKYNAENNENNYFFTLNVDQVSGELLITSSNNLYRINPNSPETYEKITDSLCENNSKLHSSVFDSVNRLHYVNCYGGYLYIVNLSENGNIISSTNQIEFLSLTIDPTNNFVYGVNGNPEDITVYQINSIDASVRLVSKLPTKTYGTLFSGVVITEDRVIHILAQNSYNEIYPLAVSLNSNAPSTSNAICKDYERNSCKTNLVYIP